MRAKDLLVDVLKTAPDVPAALVAAAADVSGCDESCFDASYLEFLDTQGRLGARGPEWTERLARRRAGLAPFCGVRLVRGTVHTAASDFTVYVDPARRAVVYWEEYPLDS